MFTFRFLTAFGSAADHWAMTSVLIPVAPGGGELMLAGSAAMGRYHVLDDSGGVAQVLASHTLADAAGVFMLSDAAVLNIGGAWQLWGASHTGMTILRHALGPGGGLTPLAPLQTVAGVQMEVSVLEPVTVAGVTYLATAAHDRSTIDLIRPAADGTAWLTARQADTPKSTLDGVSDMISLTIGGEVYLIAASARKDGLTSFHLGAGGTLQLADTMTAKDGLWVEGLDALASVSLGGLSYIIAGSAAAGSLSVIRINALGVMFITDQIWDSRDTRFDGVTQIETAEVNGRALVLAAGGDGGLSLLELLPNGQLFHHTSLEARGDWSAFAGGVTGLSLRQIGDRLVIYAAGAGGLVQFEIGLGDLGPMIRGGPGDDSLTGGAGDDLIIGGGGADTLSGGAGDDILIASVAGSRFEGGAGADVFHPGAGPAISGIADFVQGEDRIDLSDWGRIYDLSALSIRVRSYGAEISYGDNLLRVSQPGGGRIEVASWSADDFLFG